MALLKGLQIIDQAGLPHPTWEFVRKSAELKKYKRTKAYVGWTVRTVELKGRPWRSMFVNHINKTEVPTAVDCIQKKQGGGAIIAVYPSWHWRRGGTILIEKPRILVEVTRGHLSNLVRQGRLDVAYQFQSDRLVLTQGDPRLLSINQRQALARAIKQIKQDNIVLEWSISTQNKLIFFRLDKIKMLSKLLLEKYS